MHRYLLISIKWLKKSPHATSLSQPADHLPVMADGVCRLRLGADAHS